MHLVETWNCTKDLLATAALSRNHESGEASDCTFGLSGAVPPHPEPNMLNPCNQQPPNSKALGLARVEMKPVILYKENILQPQNRTSIFSIS